MTEFAMIGLGRMGGNMARRLALAGTRLCLFDQNQATAASIAAETGAARARSLVELLQAVAAPRVVWLMLPAGEATNATIAQLELAPGDILVDGANAFYKDSQARASELASRGIHFVDAGVSGGVHGLTNGYCLMLGGEAPAIAALEKYLRILAPAAERGWLHCGPAGSGHFVKMIHNGIEYGMMQAFAEGFALVGGKREFALDLGKIAELWRHGSVVRSWLLDVTAEFLGREQTLEAVLPYVDDSGEGRWTALEAVEQGVPAPVMSLALMMRFASRGNGDYAAKVLAKMREGFGGHAAGTNRQSGR
jgi:6-phosphogluconate dehydrogenase